MSDEVGHRGGLLQHGVLSSLDLSIRSVLGGGAVAGLDSLLALVVIDERGQDGEHGGDNGHHDRDPDVDVPGVARVHSGEDRIDDAGHGDDGLDADGRGGGVTRIRLGDRRVQGAVPEAGGCNTGQEAGDASDGGVVRHQHDDERDDVQNAAENGRNLTTDAVGDLAANPHGDELAYAGPGDGQGHGRGASGGVGEAPLGIEVNLVLAEDDSLHAVSQVAHVHGGNSEQVFLRPFSCCAH